MNLAHYLDPPPHTYDHDSHEPDPPSYGCHKCNGAGRIVVGHYDDGEPVDELCECYVRYLKENHHEG